MLLGGLSIEDAIRLYFEKRAALKNGDLATLSTLRQNHPSLFFPQTQEDVETIIDYVHSLERLPDFSRRYTEFLREKNKKKINGY